MFIYIPHTIVCGFWKDSWYLGLSAFVVDFGWDGLFELTFNSCVSPSHTGVHPSRLSLIEAVRSSMLLFLRSPWASFRYGSCSWPHTLRWSHGCHYTLYTLCSLNIASLTHSRVYRVFWARIRFLSHYGTHFSLILIHFQHLFLYQISLTILLDQKFTSYSKHSSQVLHACMVIASVPSGRIWISLT